MTHRSGPTEGSPREDGTGAETAIEDRRDSGFLERYVCVVYYAVSRACASRVAPVGDTSCSGFGYGAGLFLRPRRRRSLYPSSICNSHRFLNRLSGKIVHGCKNWTPLWLYCSARVLSNKSDPPFLSTSVKVHFNSGLFLPTARRSDLST